MTRCLPGLLVALLVLSAAPAFASLQVGDVAPDFALTDSAGVVHRLSDFRGQVVQILGWQNF
jgi:hypothetical protein